eukprot:5711972-Amphidinium_carterae.1
MQERREEHKMLTAAEPGIAWGYEGLSKHTDRSVSIWHPLLGTAVEETQLINDGQSPQVHHCAALPVVACAPRALLNTITKAFPCQSKMKYSPCAWLQLLEVFHRAKKPVFAHAQPVGIYPDISQTAPHAGILHLRDSCT